jgi:hypothetical protein
MADIQADTPSFTWSLINCTRLTTHVNLTIENCIPQWEHAEDFAARNDVIYIVVQNMPNAQRVAKYSQHNNWRLLFPFFWFIYIFFFIFLFSFFTLFMLCNHCQFTYQVCILAKNNMTNKVYQVIL